MVDIIIQPVRKRQDLVGIRQEQLCAQIMSQVYQKYATRKGWGSKLNTLNESGTYKLSIFDKQSYRRLQFEQGLHRIQRVSFDEKEQSRGVLTSLVVVVVQFYPFTFNVNTNDLHLSPMRTYNFSQLRVTDHRLDLSLFILPSFLEGDLDPLIDI